MITKIKRMDVRGWSLGLIAAAVAGIGSALGNIVATQFIDPVDFALDGSRLWKLVGTGALVNAVIGIGLYLKQSPIPPLIEVETITTRTEVFQGTGDGGKVTEKVEQKITEVKEP